PTQFAPQEKPAPSDIAKKRQPASAKHKDDATEPLELDMGDVGDRAKAPPPLPEDEVVEDLTAEIDEPVETLEPVEEEIGLVDEDVEGPARQRGRGQLAEEMFAGDVAEEEPMGAAPEELVAEPEPAPGLEDLAEG